MPYHHFDLWIEPGEPARYRLRAHSAAAGETFAELPQLDPELARYQEKLEQEDIDREGLIDLGTRLYDCLFVGNIREAFAESIGDALSIGEEGVCLRLRIAPPELFVLPWEFTYSSRRGLLGGSVQFPLVRYLEVAQPIRRLMVEPPIRMLVAIPRSPNLRVAEEKANLLFALSDLIARNLVELTLLEDDVTLQHLANALAAGSFDVFHFIGHGSFFDGRAYLRLDGEGGRLHDVAEEEFCALFADPPKLVFLNSCEGAATSSSKPMLGMAPQLVAKGVPAVVAMQYEVHDKPAVAFSREFYHSLFRGAYRGRVDAAMCVARKRLAADFPGQRDIGAPVLFLRAADGVLFDFDAGKMFPNPLANSNRALDRSQVYARAHRRNIALLRSGGSDDADPVRQGEIEGEETALRGLKQYRNSSLVLAIGLAVVLFFGAYLQVFDLLQLDTRVRNLAMWAGDALAPTTVDRDIVIVPITQKTIDLMGKSEIDRSWRASHAVLVDRLSGAGAKVIAFDLTFPASGEHAEFVASMVRARQRGTAVIVGVKEFDADTPRLAPEIRDAATGWGISCIGARLGSAATVPVSVERSADSAVGVTGATAGSEIPSLASLAYYWRGIARADVASFDPFRHRITASVATDGEVMLRGFGLDPGRLPISESQEVRSEQPDCRGIRAGDILRDRILVLGRPAPREQRVPYETIVRQTALEMPERFKDKIVVVGTDLEPQRLAALHGTSRPYVDVQADAINTLVKGLVVRPQGQAATLALIMVLALGGIAAQWRRPSRVQHWDGLMLAAAATICAAVSVLIYLSERVLLDTLYHFFAFALAYFGAAKLRRGWLR